jgi:hypothetical protein
LIAVCCANWAGVGVVTGAASCMLGAGRDNFASACTVRVDITTNSAASATEDTPAST